MAQLSSVDLPAGQKEIAEKFIKQAEDFQANDKLMEAANSYNKAAFLYWNQGSAAEAERFFKKSLEINYKIGNSNAIRSISTNLGLIYSDAGMPKQAIHYFNESLKVNKQLASKKHICSDLLNIAMAYTSLGDFEKSNSLCQQSLELANELEDVRLIKSCYGLLAENYEKLGDKEKSFEYFEYFISLDKHLQDEKMDEIEAKAAEVEKKAVEVTKELQTTKDTLTEIKDLSRKQQAEITLLNKEKEIEELKRKQEQARNRHVMIIVGGVILFLLIIAVILFISIRQKHKTNKLLEYQNTEIIQQQEVIKKKNQNILESINYAKRIQSAILPPPEGIRDIFPESFILFKPRDVVSGDFYWYSSGEIKSVIAKQTDGSENDNDRVSVVSAIDCTGHGVPGAFMSMVGFNLLQEILSKGIVSPEKVLSVLNIGVANLLKQEVTDNRDGMDMSVCMVNHAKKQVEFAGAKNPLVYIQDGKMSVIKGDRYPIGGIFQNLIGKRSYKKHLVKCDKPTTFYIYSDGFQDQIGGERGRKFMSTKFREYLFSIHDKPMVEQKELLERKFSDWLGNSFEQNDDILIIGFKL